MVTDPTRRRPDAECCSRIGGITVHQPRGPRRYFDEITGGYALYPLIILFGLNAVDELDRTVFGVLGPEIRDPFGLTNQGYLTLIALTLLGGLLLEVPLAYYADRLPRVRDRGARRRGVGGVRAVHRARDDDPACS